MDTGYENNVLEKVTPRRYDQIWVCSVSVAASYWIQRVNLSFESPHPTATKDILYWQQLWYIGEIVDMLTSTRQRYTCWHTHPHTHVASFFSLEKFPTATAWWKGWMFPQFLQLPAICSQESRETRLQADSPLSIEIYGLAAWKPGVQKGDLRQTFKSWWNY